MYENLGRDRRIPDKAAPDETLTSPLAPKRMQCEQISIETIARALELATRGCSCGAVKSTKLSGYLENANVISLIKGAGRKLEAHKLGWGDFVLGSIDNPTGVAGALRPYGDIGPIYILPQMEAYMLTDRKFKRYRNRPTEYLEQEAVYLINGDKIIANSNSSYCRQKYPAQVEKRALIASELPATTKTELLAKIRTKAVKDIIGAGAYEKLLDHLPPDLDAASRETARLSRVYLNWLTQNDPRQCDYDRAHNPEVQLACTFESVKSLVTCTTGISVGDIEAIKSVFAMASHYDHTSQTFKP